MITLSIDRSEVGKSLWELLVEDTLGYPITEAHDKCCYIEIDVVAFRDRTKELEEVYAQAINLKPTDQ